MQRGAGSATNAAPDPDDVDVPRHPRTIRSRVWCTAAALATTALLAVLAATLWLRAHPQQLLAALNARLPAGVVVQEVRGLSAWAAGGRIGRLRLELAGTTVSIDDARWYWSIESVRPLRIAAGSLAIAALEARLAPGSAAARDVVPLLPRFWTLGWWPALAHSGATVEQLRLVRDDGTGLLAGELAVADAGATGHATLRAPSGIAAQLRWQPLANEARAWRIEWQADAGASAHGTLDLRAAATADAIAWELRAEMPAFGPAPALSELALDAAGSADLFAAMDPLLVARLQVTATLDTPLGPAPARCVGTFTAAQSLAAVISLDACDARVETAGLALRMPLLFTLDAAWSAGSLGTSGGSLRLSGLPEGGWNLRELRFESPAATLWEAGSTTLAAPATSFAIELAEPAHDLALRLAGGFAAQRFDLARPRATLRASLHASRGRERLQQPLELRATLAAGDGTLGVDGTLAHPAIGRLLAWRLTHAWHDATLGGELTLDTSAWRWGEGLLHTLLGEGQTLFTGDLRAGMLRATARLDGSAQNPRVRLQGSASGLGGTVGRAAFVGLDCAPFGLVWRTARLKLSEDIVCAARSVNAGITIDALRATLHQTAAGWQLRDVGATVLGGSVTVAAIDAAIDGPLDIAASVRGIDLARVATLLAKPELGLGGRLDGELPLRLANGVPTLHRGTVRSAGPGVIRYRGTSAPAQESVEVSLSRKALSNLEFDSLEATLDYGADGTLAVAAAIRGRNPDLDTTRPVHLNLTLETNLRTLMRSLSAADRVNAWLEKRL